MDWVTRAQAAAKEGERAFLEVVMEYERQATDPADPFFVDLAQMHARIPKDKRMTADEQADFDRAMARHRVAMTAVDSRTGRRID